MKKKIKIKDQDIDYVARRSKRAKRLRLAVYCDGSFIVTIPRGFSISRAEEFILKQAEWVLEKLNIMKGRSQSRVFMRRSRQEYLKLRSDAQTMVQAKVDKFNELYKLKYNKVTIRNQKTRWGSCSKKGNLNFNYKIVFLPEKYAEYIIVHELCHLQEFNHSRKFWDLVSVALPDCRKLARDLRRI